MPEKFERCVQDIKDKGEADGVNPWAVCHASTGELKAEEPDKLLNELDDIISGDASFPPADASYKHTGPMVPTKSDHSYENSLEDWRLKEIDDMLAKTATFPTSNSSFKHKTSGLVTRPKPNTFGNTENETVSIPGSLSAVKIKGKKNEAHSMQETVYKSILDKKLNSCGCKKKTIQETRVDRSDLFFKHQVVEAQIMSKEGGPGSGPQPGGGRKERPTPEDPLGVGGGKADYDPTRPTPEDPLGVKTATPEETLDIVSDAIMSSGPMDPETMAAGDAGGLGWDEETWSNVLSDLSQKGKINRHGYTGKYY